MMFFKIAVLKKFLNFAGKHLCWGLFLIKLTHFVINFSHFAKKQLSYFVLISDPSAIMNEI